MATRVTRLFKAIEKGKFSEVVAILDETPELLEAHGTDTANMRDKTPLMYAMQCQATHTARELIRRGADVKARMAGGPGSAVIQLAVKFAGPREQDHASMMKLVGELIDHGADPTDALWPACHAYSPSFPWRVRMIELLLARGADPDRRDREGGETTRDLIRINARLYPDDVLRLFSVG